MIEDEDEEVRQRASAGVVPRSKRRISARRTTQALRDMARPRERAISRTWAAERQMAAAIS
ncbi:hypothetical protein DFR50_12580 [Roseiarcus fermentans]|uniref:Uncharacterized protein n=2 Tax=Roseiarcus fermentans TaxID=1473586 RepID=A0A366F1R9_9HYPH|nr:hypothetical protein DFR50_12580 [Roseiarcus fermentans]